MYIYYNIYYFIIISMHEISLKKSFGDCFCWLFSEASWHYAHQHRYREQEDVWVDQVESIPFCRIHGRLR